MEANTALSQSFSELPGLHPEQVVQVLHDAGYRGRLDSVNDVPVVASAAFGLDIWINLFVPQGQLASSGFGAYQFETGIYLKRHAIIPGLLEACNRYNLMFRFAKACIGNFDGQPYVTLRVDLSARGDVTANFARDFDAFLHMLQKFAEEILSGSSFSGHSMAEQHNLALNCLWGPERDIAEGIRAYREAAWNGYAGSQNNLGDMYERAEFVEKSPVYAAHLYTRAAERGEPTAYLSLATMLADDAADDHVLVEAAKFAILAAERLPGPSNRHCAISSVKALRDRLTPEQMELAQQLADSWSPLYNETQIMGDPPAKNTFAQESNYVIH